MDMIEFEENPTIQFESEDFADWESINFEDTDPLKNTIIYDGLYALFKPKIMDLAKPFLTHCATYIDKNAESLLISGPYKKLWFIEQKDSDPLFNMFGLIKSEVKSIMKKSPLLSDTFITLGNPLFFLLTMLNLMYRDYPSKELARECVNYSSLFMALRFYSSRQQHLWKYDANKDIMEYTINNMTEKYLLRKESTILGVLKYISSDNDSNLGLRLYKSHTDHNMKTYITNLSMRINNFLRNVFNEYRKNVEKQKYLGESSDWYQGDDGTQTMKPLDNLSSIITDLTQKVYNKIKSTPVDKAILRDAATTCKISSETICNTLEMIFQKETKAIQNIIIKILQIFLKNPKNKVEYVKSKYFMIYCIKMYRISNTIDPLLEELKQNLDDIVVAYGSQFLKLNRPATRSAFRKSIFLYIAGCITKYG